MLTLVCILSACSKCEETSGLPDCIETIIANNTGYDTIKTVQVQTIDGNLHYWLETGAMSYDGTEAIVNAECDTLCTIGGWLPPECSNNYIYENWETIWKR